MGKIKSFFQKLSKWIKLLFNRSDRVELAVQIAKGLKDFADSQGDDLLFFIAGIIGTMTGTSAYITSATTIAKNFLNNDLPTLLKALELIDASDETKIKETNINAVVAQVKEFCATVDIDTLTTLVTKDMKDGKLSLEEAKEILSEYVQS